MDYSTLQRTLFLLFTAFLTGLQEVRRSRLASALATEGMIVNLKNVSVHVPGTVYMYMSHLFMICVSLRLYFLQRGP